MSDHLIDEQGRHSLDCWCYAEPYHFVEKMMAKSSTSAMVSSVCQKCGHKLDGKKRSKVNPITGGAGEPCSCRCHEGA